jgi:hypothetical protein
VQSVDGSRIRLDALGFADGSHVRAVVMGFTWTAVAGKKNRTHTDVAQTEKKITKK